MPGFAAQPSLIDPQADLALDDAVADITSPVPLSPEPAAQAAPMEPQA
jgi:hypothetical protein